MVDVFTPVLMAYYDALSGLGYPVYQGEEPDDELAPAYIVISDLSSQDASTQSSSDLAATIQINIHTWENKYNTAVTANTIAGLVYDAIKPQPTHVLDVAGMQMLCQQVVTDRLERVGELGGRKYISRIIIIQSNLFIFTT